VILSSNLNVHFVARNCSPEKYVTKYILHGIAEHTCVNCRARFIRNIGQHSRRFHDGRREFCSHRTMRATTGLHASTGCKTAAAKITLSQPAGYRSLIRAKSHDATMAFIFLLFHRARNILENHSVLSVCSPLFLLCRMISCTPRKNANDW